MDLKSVLKMDNVSLINQDMGWEQAVRLATKPLVEQGYVEERYPDEIIKNTLEFGPYYILVEGVAFLHVRPEQGVIKDQIAVTVNKSSVKFSEDDPSRRANLLITFAAEGSESHLEIMQALAEILTDEERTRKIIEANSEEEIYQLMVD